MIIAIRRCKVVLFRSSSLLRKTLKIREAVKPKTQPSSTSRHSSRLNLSSMPASLTSRRCQLRVRLSFFWSRTLTRSYFNCQGSSSRQRLQIRSSPHPRQCRCLLAPMSLLSRWLELTPNNSRSLGLEPSTHFHLMVCKEIRVLTSQRSLSSHALYLRLTVEVEIKATYPGKK